MTSGKFTTFPIPSITIERSERQRRELTGIEDLAESIRRTGLINPIVITQDGVLVAGERRLTACKMLGWTSIPAQFTSDLSALELHVIELEENIKREQLSWQDECLAVKRFHELKMEMEEDWDPTKTATALGATPQYVGQRVIIAKEIEDGNERISSADKFSVARNLVQRDTERRKSSVLETLGASLIPPSISDEPAPKTKPTPPILLTDFHQWQGDYAGQKFNLIHCDFPYGINVGDSPRQNSSIAEHYEDSPDVYFKLLATFGLAMQNVVAESAHLIFWFTMHYYSETLAALEFMGWKVDPFPLIWHKSDNAGVAPDPQRRPRRTYETAFFASRGDRKLTQAGARSASFAFPGKIGGEAHMSAKPVPMLTHFLSMVCDEYSTVFDPTCGSGNALKAATALGASSVLGLEKDPNFYALSTSRYYGDEDEVE